MDEGTRAADEVGEATEGGERTPEEIRADIEQTRAELGDTVEALADKADVKKQAKGRVNEAKSRARAAKAEAVKKKDEALGQAKAASPDTAQEGAQQLAAAAGQNREVLVVAGAFLAGLLIGRRSAR
jgi:hypothetical protein